jgi:hypothetical protein
MMQCDPAVDVMLRHLNLTEDKARYWLNFIAQITYSTEPHIFDLKRDVENLENLDRALCATLAALDVSAMTQAAQSALWFKILYGPVLDLSGSDTESLVETLRYPPLQRGGKEATDALRAMQDNIPIIREAIRSARRHIEQSPRAKIGTRRINLEGVQLVDCARLVWCEASGKDAPSKSLNPASKFGMFLCDLFEVLEVEGDPRSAFRAWAGLQ